MVGSISDFVILITSDLGERKFEKARTAIRIPQFEIPNPKSPFAPLTLLAFLPL